MKHLSEEELVEQHYGEGAADAARHLKACAQCGAALADLECDLAAIEPVEPPARDAAWGERVWARLAPSLTPYPPRPPFWLRRGFWQPLGYAAACALLAAAAFYAGRQWEHRRPPTTAANPPAPATQQVKQPVILVVLGDHLDRSERLLVELKHADPDSAELTSPLRDEARTLLAANRVCRQNADQNKDPDLATALDRLDRLLSQLASEPDGLNGATLTRLQDEMNSDGLLFEVRVLRSRLPDQRGSTARSNGGTI